MYKVVILLKDSEGKEVDRRELEFPNIHWAEVGFDTAFESSQEIAQKSLTDPNA